MQHLRQRIGHGAETATKVSDHGQKTPRRLSGDNSSDRYFELVHQFQLRPIRGEDELARAIDLVNSLVDRGEMSVDEEDYVEVLEDLIEKYEARRITPLRMPRLWTGSVI